MLRRNLNIKVMLFNNEIYGLTKGQYSPNVLIGQDHEIDPDGAIDNPFIPVAVALERKPHSWRGPWTGTRKHLQEIVRRGKTQGIRARRDLSELQRVQRWRFFTFTEKETRDDNVVSLEQ
jgi:2-oxoglutarate ferredoxin oxidoreductase subunit beta